MKNTVLTAEDEALAALDMDDPERALEIVEEAMRTVAPSAMLLGARAEALAMQGLNEDAHSAYSSALKLFPDDPGLLSDAIGFLFEDCGDDHDALADAVSLAARGCRSARRSGDTSTLAAFLLQEGRCRVASADARGALRPLDEALGLFPDDPEIRLERGIALFELCRFEEARATFNGVLALAPEEGAADHYLGLLCERAGDRRGARAHFARARRSCPDGFPKPVELSSANFDHAVSEAIASLPPRARGCLNNVTIEVQEVPAEGDLVANDPPLSPLSLGMFRGVPVPEKTVGDPYSHFPSAIILYQRNLERYARDREELLEQIGVTLLHEVGHFLGLDEGDLYGRGLD